jgi:hypothetical protein
MLCSYPVACPHANCGWKGNLVPSLLQGGVSEEVTAMQRAWFRCPHCGEDWEVRIEGDKVSIIPVLAPSDTATAV